MITNNTPSERDTALLALLLDRPEPAPGPRPDLDELWDWQAGLIEGPRADEIKAHIARDPEIYAMWRELRLALEEPSPEVEERQVPAGSGVATKKAWYVRFVEWLFPEGFGVGALATAALMGVAVVVGIQLYRHGPQDEILLANRSGEGISAFSDNGGNVQKSRETFIISSETIGPLPSDWREMSAFAYGFAESAKELTDSRQRPRMNPFGGGRPFPDQMPACANVEDGACAKQLETLSQLGGLMAEAFFQCRSKGNGLDKATVERLRGALVSLPKSERFHKVLADLRRDLDSKAACARVQVVIERGLGN